MAAFKNVGLDGYIKRYGFKYGIRRGIFVGLPIHIVKDYENRKLLYYYKAENYIRKKYLKYAEKDPLGIECGHAEIHNPVWVYWGQKVENAPEIVKACIKSMESHCNNLIILDQQNVSEYIKFPPTIRERLEKGKISSAAYSDLLRLSLLEHYGGTWLDATVLLTGSIPNYIQESDFFAFRDQCGLMYNPAYICSWFLHSNPHHIAIREARNILFAYWEHESSLIEYLLVYIVLNLSIEKNSELIGNFPYASSDYTRLLFNTLDKTYNPGLYGHIMELSAIHKLTYKLTEETLSNRDNLFHFLLSQRKNVNKD